MGWFLNGIRPMAFATKMVPARQSFYGPTPGWSGRVSLLIGLIQPFLLLVGGAHATNPAFQESFDGPEVVWRAVDVAAHDAVAEQSVVVVEDQQKSSTGAESILVFASGGTSVRLQIAVGRAPVLDELKAKVWVRSNRMGLALAATVVLPREHDPETGLPLELEVVGMQYRDVGEWQLLELINLPELLKRRVRTLRVTKRKEIDPHEAYLSHLRLVVPGGPGGTRVVTNDLQLEGVLFDDRPKETTSDFPKDEKKIPWSQPDILQVGWSPEAPQAPSASSRHLAGRVELYGTRLLVDGRPFFPRVITHNGEPLSWLAGLGFNTVLLDTFPTTAMQREATARNLWLLSPPPSPEQLAEGKIPDAANVRRILGWYFDLEAALIPPGQRYPWIESVRNWDAQLNRPVLMEPPGVREYDCRFIDALVLGRWFGGSQVRLQEHAEWFRQQRALVEPGVPSWCRLDLTPNGLACEQTMAAMGGVIDRADLLIDERQIDALVKLAITSGCGGLVIRSEDSLHQPTVPAVQRRVAALTLMNLQLQLIAPWLAGGRVTGMATCSNPAWTASVVQVEQAHLVIPMEWSSPTNGPDDSQKSPRLTLIVPGVPESNQVFELTSANLLPLVHKRVAGGIQVQYAPLSEGLIVLTENPRAIRSLRQQTARMAAQSARLRCELATLRLVALRQQARNMQDKFLVAAHEHITEANALATRKDYPGAYTAAIAADQQLDCSFKQQTAANGTGSTVTSDPITAGLDTVGSIATLRAAIASRKKEANQLYGGDFEDLDQIVRFGWKHVTREVPEAVSRVELVGDAPYHGSYCLAMTTRPSSQAEPSTLLAETPVWVTSPPVPVQEGEMVEVTGWVRIDEPITGHADGLQVVDNLGGPDLSIRIRKTDGWQLFRIVRHVPASTNFQLTFALHGFGKVRLDAIMVRPLAAAVPPVRRESLPVTTRPLPTALRPAQPLFDGPKLR